MASAKLPYGKVYDEIASRVMSDLGAGKDQIQIAVIVIGMVRKAGIPLREGYDEPRVELGVRKKLDEEPRHILRIYGLSLPTSGTGCVELCLHY
ncbi:hypothetical protein HN358_00560 [Candidatus Uhrbacteria bacterium]|nr:hypothetical protein [Candidatus Uhrbacteria bacterium]MBT7717377.1 hypothetical protein [Candidatus Uhrbacteria bacterium]